MDGHLGVFGQARLQGLGLFGGRREGVDAPDALVLVFLEDGIGGPFQHDVGVDGLGGGFSGGAGAAGDNLECGLGHFSNAGMVANRKHTGPAMAGPF